VEFERRPAGVPRLPQTCLERRLRCLRSTRARPPLLLRVVTPPALFACSGAALLVIIALGVVFAPIRQIRDVEDAHREAG
jgi:hypothetical protein